MKSSINILSIILNVFLIFAVIVLLFDRDDEEEIIKFRDNEYIVNGSAKLDDVNEVLGTNFEFEDVESIGGYVIALVDRFPKKGEQISDKTADFTILLSEKNRIEKMRIVLKKQSEDIDEVKENWN